MCHLEIPFLCLQQKPLPLQRRIVQFSWLGCQLSETNIDEKLVFKFQEKKSGIPQWPPTKSYIDPEFEAATTKSYQYALDIDGESKETNDAARQE